MPQTPSDSPYTKSVNELLADVLATSPNKTSVYEQAELFFTSQDSAQRTLSRLAQDITSSMQDIDTAKVEAKKAAAKVRLVKAKKALNDEQGKQDRQRYARLKSFNQVCVKIIQLTEGKDWHETQKKSAKLLGTLLLLSPCEGATVASMHQKLKPIYRGVLAVRLLDQLLKINQLDNRYVISRYNQTNRFSQQAGTLSQFQREVVIPVISAALLQDIGLQHPEIQRLIKGSDGSLSEFRVLEKELRVPLLVMNHEQTLSYLKEGLGKTQISRENDQSPEYNEFKNAFDKQNINRLGLIRRVLNDAIKPTGSLGNVLKISQIYSSIVLSTKPGFKFSDLPKAAMVIDHTGKKGGLNVAATECFVKLVGHFPQGFGLVFVSPQPNQQPIDQYNYAIVNALEPPNPFAAWCKIVTNQLKIAENHQQTIIYQEQNLYYEQSKQQLGEIDASRLQVVGQALADSLAQPKMVESIPSFWLPHGYFYFKKHQKIWD